MPAPGTRGGILRILASWPLDFLLQGVSGDALTTAQSYIFVVAGTASLVLAAYCLILPHTPPKPATESGERTER